MYGFYQDPARDLSDADICAPCDCFADGTVDEGECDGATIPEMDEVAGQCHCKTYVGGIRCDRCMAGTHTKLYQILSSNQVTGISPLRTLMVASSAPATPSARCSQQTAVVMR